MENENTVTGGDIFTRGWEDETEGITADGREEEPLPEDAGPGEDISREGEAGDGPGKIPAEEGGPEKPEDPPVLPSAARDRDGEIRQFVLEYPGVMPEAIPEEVWRRVRAGESLTTAYTRHEARRLRRENLRLETELAGRRQAEANRQRSAGSQMGAGTGKPARDPFDDGWELEW